MNKAMQWPMYHGCQKDYEDYDSKIEGRVTQIALKLSKYYIIQMILPKHEESFRYDNANDGFLGCLADC